jgi:hypothetical protein
MIRRRFRDLAVTRWFETLLPPKPLPLDEAYTEWADEPETVESGWTPTVPDILTEPETPPPAHTPRRSRESLQILEQLRDLAADRAEIERLNAYADHWRIWWNTQLEQARQQRERTEDMRASFAAFEWRILL